MGLAYDFVPTVVSAVFLGLAVLFVTLRCTCRFIIIRRGGLDDYILVIALVFSVGMMVAITIQGVAGVGDHVEELSDSQVQIIVKMLYVNIICYTLGLFYVKISILHQYLRFLRAGYRRVTLGLLVFIPLAAVAFVFAFSFSCHPVAYFWDKSIAGGTCIDLMALSFALAGVSLATDLAVWILPMPVVTRLKIPKKQKIALTLAFAVGGLACIMGIIRLHSIYMAWSSPDLTYNNVGADCWSVIELNIGIICACVPALKPMVNLVSGSTMATAGSMDPSRLATSHLHSQSNKRDAEMAILVDNSGAEPRQVNAVPSRDHSKASSKIWDSSNSDTACETRAAHS